MNTIKLKTGGMHCPSCSMLIEMNVSDLPGVESVRSSHADGLTTVTYDPSATDADKIAAEIRTAGYDAELLS
jgi:copper chaperone CopZ